MLSYISYVKLWNYFLPAAVWWPQSEPDKKWTQLPDPAAPTQTPSLSRGSAHSCPCCQTCRACTRRQSTQLPACRTRLSRSLVGLVDSALLRFQMHRESKKKQFDYQIHLNTLGASLKTYFLSTEMPPRTSIFNF